jgi:hypothetical protein
MLAAPVDQQLGSRPKALWDLSGSVGHVVRRFAFRRMPPGLGQVLSADHSCRAAVARLIAHRLSRRERPCSATTGAYCQARKRLPEQFFSTVACSVGRALDAKVDSRWLWKGRRVFIFDGTTVSMPDTPENQAAYPQVYNQKPGLGFPIARIAVITSLACGAILNLGFCQYAGKGQGEVSLLRRLWDVFRRGDVASIILFASILVARQLSLLVGPRYIALR